MRHTAGELFVPESGCYSDFGYLGVFKVLRNFDTPSEAKTYKAEFAAAKTAESNDWDTPNPPGFLAFLVKTGAVEEVNYVSEHLGNYGDLEIAP